MRSDFEGGNIRWGEMTEYSSNKKRIKLDIWLVSDIEIKEKMLPPKEEEKFELRRYLKEKDPKEIEREE